MHLVTSAHAFPNIDSPIMVKLSNLHPKNIFFAHIIGRCGFLPTWGFHSKPGSGDVTRCPFDKKYCNYFRISQYYYSVQTFVSAVKFINLIKYRFCLIWNIFMEERGKLYRYTSLSVSPWKKKTGDEICKLLLLWSISYSPGAPCLYLGYFPNLV